MYLAASAGPKRAMPLSPTACQIPLHPLLDLINSSDHCYTTSSCSGRISVYLAPAESPEPSESLQQIVEEASDDGSQTSNEVPESPGSPVVAGEENGGKGKGAARSQTINGKTGGSYIWCSHTQVKVPTEEYEVMDLLFKGVPVLPWEDTAPLSNDETMEETRKGEGGGILTFSFDAMVLNITSSSLAHAALLLQAALRCGSRSSGLVVPSDDGGDVVLNVRTSSMSMGIPIARRIVLPPTRNDMAAYLKDTDRSLKPSAKVFYQLLVPPSYLAFLLRQANLRMAANAIRVERLYSAYDEILGGGKKVGREERRSDRAEGEKERVEKEEEEREKEDKLDKRMRDGVGTVADWLRETGLETPATNTAER